MNIEVIDENLIDIQLQEEVLNLAKKKAKWNANRATLSSIVNALHKIGIESELTGNLDVSVTGDKKRLADIIRIFRIAGFSSDAERPKQGDSSWYAYFSHPNCSVRIWFCFSSSVCKRVKTGSKMVSVDTYETVCGDISEELPCATALISETESTPALPNDIPF
jgi:hypothetical protein